MTKAKRAELKDFILRMTDEELFVLEFLMNQQKAKRVLQKQNAPNPNQFDLFPNE